MSRNKSKQSHSDKLSEHFVKNTPPAKKTIPEPNLRIRIISSGMFSWIVSQLVEDKGLSMIDWFANVLRMKDCFLRLFSWWCEGWSAMDCFTGLFRTSFEVWDCFPWLFLISWSKQQIVQRRVGIAFWHAGWTHDACTTYRDCFCSLGKQGVQKEIVFGQKQIVLRHLRLFFLTHQTMLRRTWLFFVEWKNPTNYPGASLIVFLWYRGTSKVSMTNLDCFSSGRRNC